MLYRIIDERQVEQFPLYIEVNGEVYTNSLAEAEALKTGDWFELVADPKPEYDPETQYLLRRYIQEEEHIHQVWEINEKGVMEDASNG